MYLSLSKSGSETSRKISDLLRKTGLKNIFNPSICRMSSSNIISFRALAQDGTKPFEAYIAQTDIKFERITSLFSLTKAFMDHIKVPISDPKVFMNDNECWVTFNTGHFEKPNSIYISRVSPSLDNLMRVEFGNRRIIEKNWGFFFREKGLQAVYSLSPLIVLKEKSRSETSIHFDVIDDFNNLAPFNNTSRPRLTIGTQPCLLEQNCDILIMVAHRRTYLQRKRIYTGRPVTINLKSRSIKIGFRPWLHSIKKLLGDTRKHNPNLISCTYFSGISVLNKVALLGYGINDLDYGFSEVPLRYWYDAERELGVRD